MPAAGNMPTAAPGAPQRAMPHPGLGIMAGFGRGYQGGPVPGSVPSPNGMAQAPMMPAPGMGNLMSGGAVSEAEQDTAAAAQDRMKRNLGAMTDEQFAALVAGIKARNGGM